ncbi:MAG: hypothetical protein ACPGVG_02050 [Mycobacterium sp.]
MTEMPRVQAVVLPILRAYPALDGVTIGSWTEDIDYRTLPMINVRRLGGLRHETRPTLLDRPVIEMTVYHSKGIVETEDLYADALEALYAAAKNQTQTEAGYLHSIKETMGQTQSRSEFIASWKVQGHIALGLRSK